MDLSQIITPAIVSAAVAGGVSLVAPWITWGVDQRRERQKARQETISQVREILKAPPDCNTFARLPIYFQIKPYLDPKTINAVEGAFNEHGTAVIRLTRGGPYRGANQYAHLVLADISALERKWKLL